MTEEHKQNVLIIAVALSILVHVGLMVVMRPQVMTQLVGSTDAKRTRDSVVMTDVPARPEIAEMDAVQDVDALKESPTAETIVLPTSPTLQGFLQEDEPIAPEIQPPQTEVEPMKILEDAPSLSEKILVEGVVVPTVTPLAENDFSVTTPQVAESVPDHGGFDAIALAVEVPTLTSPLEMPVLGVGEEAIGSDLGVEPPLETTEDAAYTPPQEVLDQVDEKMVEEEKKAIRELLDTKDMTELAPFVSLAVDSATTETWTYFRVKVTPDASLPVVSKDVVVLLDASGSIGDDRLKSCRKAAQAILRSCTNTGDRFNLVAFRNRFSYAFRSWQTCRADSFKSADKWLNNLAAYGRTDVFSVIRSVLTLPRDPERPLIALVVTDGDANAGVSETAQILSKFSALNDGLISVYMYGVKSGANRELIDVLTHGNRGESYIHGGSRWKAGTGIETLSTRFRDPVLSDLRVVFTANSQAEVYPRLLKNLYRGENVEIVGRVPKGQTEVAFSLKGLNGDKPYEGFFKVKLADAAFDDQLPEAWKAEHAIDLKLR